MLFTGYYQPVIDGSLTPGDGFDYPIYGVPADLLAPEQAGANGAENDDKQPGSIGYELRVPYYSRREIDQLGALRGRALEIAWIKDPIDLFFLHIQGSGLLRLRDGRQVTVGYAAQNGLPYRSIGRLLIDDGKVGKDEMSMQRLRRYLTENPSEQNDIFAYNESYVFFRLNQDGPLGSLGVPVTAGRSIATVGALILYSSWSLVKDSLRSVLMQAVPKGIRLEEVRQTIEAVHGVSKVHDLHIWAVTSDIFTLSAHAVVENGGDFHEVLNGIEDTLRERYKIEHTTIQLETESREEKEFKAF